MAEKIEVKNYNSKLKIQYYFHFLHSLNFEFHILNFELITLDSKEGF